MSRTDTALSRHHAAARNYSLVCLSGLAILLIALLQRGMGWWSLVPILIGAVALPFRWSMGPVLVLLALAGMLFVDSLQFRMGRIVWLRGPAFNLADLILCGAVLAYVAGHYRLQGLVRHIFPQDPRRRPFTHPRRSQRSPAGAGAGIVHLRRSSRPVAPDEIGLLVVSVVLCAVLASFGWLWLVRQLPPPEWRLEAKVWQGILLVWLVGVALIVVSGLLGFLSWQRLTAAEAKLFLQDTVWHETRREQWRLHDWLAWARLRQQARKENK